MDPIRGLSELGQSVWLDFVDHRLLTSAMTEASHVPIGPKRGPEQPRPGRVPEPHPATPYPPPPGSPLVPKPESPSPEKPRPTGPAPHHPPDELPLRLRRLLREP
jgi:hypothetical protein